MKAMEKRTWPASIIADQISTPSLWSRAVSGAMIADMTWPDAVACSVGLFCVMAAGMEIGWRWGRREDVEDSQSPEKGLSTIQASVFGLMGLLLAFSFGGAEARLESRRHEIIEEINSINTA